MVKSSTQQFFFPRMKKMCFQCYLVVKIKIKNINKRPEYPLLLYVVII